MSNLSAAAATILSYAKEHADSDGCVDLQDYSGLSEKLMRNACKELLSHGLVSNVIYSEESVEGIILNLK